MPDSDTGEVTFVMIAAIEKHKNSIHFRHRWSVSPRAPALLVVCLRRPLSSRWALKLPCRRGPHDVVETRDDDCAVMMMMQLLCD